ncbi:MAG: PQQ-binding-like beta-propeller repeat protein [Planctomycetia bacterium]|nr:PQQ-binding-like beta-propeller repeat protein [Planctomycetia bacterium]
MKPIAFALLSALLWSALPWGRAEDWPMWGRNSTRNMVSPEKNPPTDWQVEVKNKQGEVVKAGRNIKWAVPVGRRSQGSPVVAHGMVWVGTNASKMEGEQRQDFSVLKCFRESDGKLLYEYWSPRLSGRGFHQHHDWPGSSMASSPLIEGDRLWLRTNRADVVGFDIGPLRRGVGDPKVVWKTDMIQDFGVVPHHPAMAMGVTPSLGPTYKNLLHVITGNGIDQDYEKVAAPNAPSVICLDKDTGKAVWKDASPGKNIMLSQLSSPLLAEVHGKTQVIVGLGDGWLRAFEPTTGKLIWKCDLNPKNTKWETAGRGTKNYCVGTPVFHDNRIYIGTGQDAEHYEGLAWFYCINPTKEGDISLELVDEQGQVCLNPNSGIVWRFGGPTTPKDQQKTQRDYYFGRTVGTCAIAGDLVYISEISGYVHCLDARCGKRYWLYDFKSDAYGSPLWVDGTVYVPTGDGDMLLFEHGRAKKEPRRIEMSHALYSTPVFANGVLYVLSESTLYAIQEKK